MFACAAARRPQRERSTPTFFFCVCKTISIALVYCAANVRPASEHQSSSLSQYNYSTQPNWKSTDLILCKKNNAYKRIIKSRLQSLVRFRLYDAFDGRPIDDRLPEMTSADDDDVTAGNAVAAMTPPGGADHETPGCLLYKFIVLTNVGGVVCLFGFVGNLIAFVVFQKDTMKTSTSFLFQV